MRNKLDIFYLIWFPKFRSSCFARYKQSAEKSREEVNVFMADVVQIVSIIFMFLVVAYLIGECNRLKRENESLKEDGSTGTLRREEWERRLKERLKTGGQVVCFFDIDGLKWVNDHFGHVYGDALISIFVAALRANLKQRDLIGRFGGDEFVVALDLENGELEEKIKAIINRVSKQFKEHARRFFEDEGKEPLSKFRFSAGHSSVPRGTSNIEDVLNEVDRKMYENKHENKRGL